jgi:hypothetical protein
MWGLPVLSLAGKLLDSGCFSQRPPCTSVQPQQLEQRGYNLRGQALPGLKSEHCVQSMGNPLNSTNFGLTPVFLTRSTTIDLRRVSGASSLNLSLKQNRRRNDSDRARSSLANKQQNSSVLSKRSICSLGDFSSSFDGNLTIAIYRLSRNLNTDSSSQHDQPQLIVNPEGGLGYAMLL